MGEDTSSLLRAALGRIGHEGVFVLDAEGRYLAFNDVHAAVVEAYIGRKPRPGEPFLEVIARARGLEPAALANVTICGPSGFPAFEGPGSTEMHLEPLRDGHREGVLGRHPAFGPVEATRARRAGPAPRMSELILNELNNLDVGLAGTEDALGSSSPTFGSASELLGEVRARALRAARLGEAIHASVMAPPQDTLDVHPWLRSLEPRLQAELKLDIVIESGTGPICVVGDPSELEAALLELLLNAQEAGASRVLIRTRTPRSDLGLSTPFWPSVELVVEDDGEGIPQERLGRVFEPSTTTRRHGQGLGLTRVRSVARAHGGSVWVESPPGQGTTAVLRLPLAPHPAEAQPTTQELPVVRSESLRVMVVDDAPEVRRVLARVIRHAGHDVDEAEDGLDALEQLDVDGQFPDLIVLDLMMPRMDGVETYNALRVRQPTLPILITSGYHPSSLSFLTTDPHARFLPKPFSPSEVLAALDHLIGNAA